MTRPVVAVIPCCNAALADLLASVRSALDVPGIDRVVVVDDGSAAPVQFEIDRATVIRRDNGGPAAALNTGIESLPTGAIVCRLDVGDSYRPEAKARQIGSMQAGARASGSPSFDPVANVTRRGPPNWRDLLWRTCVFAGPTLTMTREAWRRAGGFDESLRWGSDYKMLLVLHYQGALDLFPEETCIAGMFPGGHSDTSSADRVACLARVDEYARILRSPDQYAHLFDPRWCRKHGVEPFALPKRYP
jgi:glycosyltransferase involved in cell wall biosynthesis